MSVPVASSERVLGLDPGLETTGYAVAERKGSSVKLLEAGLIKTAASDSLPVRLHRIRIDLIELLERTRPDAVAIERLFFGVNVRTAIAVAQARGVMLALCAEKGLPCGEYTPSQVKRAVTGSGTAEKAQVIEMTRRLYGLSRPVAQNDAADAAALAWIHAHVPLARRKEISGRFGDSGVRKRASAPRKKK